MANMLKGQSGDSCIFLNDFHIARALSVLLKKFKFNTSFTQEALKHLDKNQNTDYSD